MILLLKEVRFSIFPFLIYPTLPPKLSEASPSVIRKLFPIDSKFLISFVEPKESDTDSGKNQNEESQIVKKKQTGMTKISSKIISIFGT